MTPEPIPDEAKEAAAAAYFGGKTNWREGFSQAAITEMLEDMERLLEAALPHLVAEAQAEIARLHGIIREMVRLSPDNPDVEDAALGMLEKPKREESG